MLLNNSAVSLLFNSLLLASLVGFAHTLMKSVAAKDHATYIEMFMAEWMTMGLSITIYFGVFLYYPVVLRHHDLAVIYPVYTGMSIVGIAVMGVYFFNETLSPLQWLGALLIALGIYLLSQSGH